MNFQSGVPQSIPSQFGSGSSASSGAGQFGSGGTVSGQTSQPGQGGSQFVLSNSAAIRAEIHRFESVHPNIYAIYDLIERIDDLALQNQIREHVISIEDSFVNSQEWTLSRSVPELKVGIVGNLSSGKSALVHRYLTGTYVQEESPEGGRFKKEIVVDGQSYLLLIRDEGGPPELQFAAWVDAVVFVFSLEDEISFQTVYNYFQRLSNYRNTAEVPMVLVGTQDAISAANPRVIDDSRARKLSNDLKRSTYYETCSTYGLNVERVFQDVAQKVVALRKKQQLSIGPCKSLPNSPSHSSVPSASIPSVHINQAANGGGAFGDYSSSVPSTPSISQREMRIETIAASNTPTPVRKQSKRRSNIFTSRKASEQAKSVDSKTDSIGSGRAIPIKQGILLKRSGKSLNKEWKKKYVTLCDNGLLTYHPSLHDYMQNVHGKEIDLLRTTVKVPGKRPPRAVATVAPTASPKTNGLTKDRSALQLGLGTTGEHPTPTSTPGYLPGVFFVEVSSAAMVLQLIYRSAPVSHLTLTVSPSPSLPLPPSLSPLPPLPPPLPREEKECWIRAKYDQKLFLTEPPLSDVPLGQQLLRAVVEDDLRLVALLSGNTNVHPPLSPTLSPPLPPPLPPPPQYGVDVTSRDARGQTPLSYARRAASQECSDILLQHGCPNDAAAVAPTTDAADAANRNPGGCELNRSISIM
uniref:ArfGAP with GTPase domain, ankyrin repeat and PH domain 3 n=1 Tax=Gadus morhua TaxID=8049 RepID=A0A8C4YYI3_GADMO